MGVISLGRFTWTLLYSVIMGGKHQLTLENPTPVAAIDQPHPTGCTFDHRCTNLCSKCPCRDLCGFIWLRAGSHLAWQVKKLNFQNEFSRCLLGERDPGVFKDRMGALSTYRLKIHIFPLQHLKRLFFFCKGPDNWFHTSWRVLGATKKKPSW